MATSTPLIKFTAADFERIKNNGFTYTLTPETLAIIQALAEQVGSPEYIKTPQFIKREVPVGTVPLQYNLTQLSNRKRRGNKPYEACDEDWDTVRNFKTTLIAKKEGMGAVIDQIRKHLNKMTAKTYDTLKENIIKEIETITDGVLEKSAQHIAIEDEEFVNEINKIGEALFTIASGNSFYSNMYAKLYKELMEKFAFMKTIFETNFKKFNTLFNDFTYCDPNKDYDQFCLNNKVNEKRRALSLFYVNLMKEQMIAQDDIEQILTQLRTNMQSAIKTADQKNIVDEMAEIVHIIITNGYEQLQELPEWLTIEDFVKTVAEYKPSSFPSITNKTIFKFMDILDVFWI